jgi:hypothetical protein
MTVNILVIFIIQFLISSADTSVRKLVFLGQVTEELASRSTFIDQIGCGKIASNGELLPAA